MFYSLKDSIVVYRRSVKLDDLREPRTEKSDAGYTNADNDERGSWITSSYVNPATKDERPNLCYPITNPNTGGDVSHETHAWKYSWETHQEHVAEKRLWWGEKGDAKYPRLKIFASDEGLVPIDLWHYRDTGTTDDGGAEIKAIFGSFVFTTPKPVSLLTRIIKLAAADRDSIVLDSFAGSGTTAHAVLALNKEDGGNRRFILCQMPHETKEQEQNKENICDTVTAERVRRVIKGVPQAKDDNLRAGLGGTFSYFRLGKELNKQAILDGKDLPSYEALAGYVFFTATGEQCEPKKVKAPFIGTSRDRDVFLIYEPDLETLKDLALNLDLARAIARRSDRKKLVFAPTRYLDQDYLERLNIEFCQLPFEIYLRAQGK
jgi:adenine-specific DNA-methyltransferase